MPLPNPKSTTDIDRRIGRRIATLRMAKGLSQTALGQALGVTFQQVQKYENGHNRIGAGRLPVIAALLDVPVVTLLDEAQDNGSAAAVDLLGTPGATDLVRAYDEIADPTLRTALINMARQFASASRASVEKAA